MKTTDRYSVREVFNGEDGDKLTVRYDNRGEPYRDGATFIFEDDRREVSVFLEGWELKQLRDLIDKLYPRPIK